MNDRAFICDQIKIDRKYGLIGNTEILVFNEFTILLTHHISNSVEWRKRIGDEVIIFYIADKFESEVKQLVVRHTVKYIFYNIAIGKVKRILDKIYATC